jgi:tRNA modification GTPase
VSAARVAVLTPKGRGAVASLLVEDAVELIDRHRLFAAANGKMLAEQEINRICFGHWQGRGGDVETGLAGEQIVVCRVSEERVELHCHGGTAAVARIFEDLAGVGVTQCEWVEMIEDGGKRPANRVEIELAQALSAATTWRTAALLLDQQTGVLVNALKRLGSVDWKQRDQAAGWLAELLEWSSLGRQLVVPPTVVLAGLPNVGKSSLLNALLGFGRAIVWDEPGTTRDVVVGHTALEGWPIRLADTAGLRATEDEIEAIGIAHARRELDSADLVVLVVDGSQGVDGDSRRLMDELSEALVVANKSDLGDVAEGELPSDALVVSALTGAGIDRLAAVIAESLVPAVPDPGTAVPVSERLIGSLERAVRAVARNDESGFRAAIDEAIG